MPDSRNPICIECKNQIENPVRILPYMPVYVCRSCLAKQKQRVISEHEIENKIKPDWTDDQVQSLAGYQNSNTYYPFVCFNNHLMEATKTGLHCFQCRFYLKWSYEWTLDWSWKLLEPPEGAGDRSRLPPNLPIGSLEITLEEPS